MSECSCAVCKRACVHKPGWFLPSDIPKLAKLLGISQTELVRERLAVDYYLLGNAPNLKAVFVLAPPNTKALAGQVYPLDTRGQCTFYQNERCAIHPAKPHECRMAIHTQRRRKSLERKAGMVRVWMRHQRWLFDLLGYTPRVREWTAEDMNTMEFLPDSRR